MPVQAVIFDLDGVITDTAHFHFLAWQALARELGVAFDEQDNEALKGIDRMGSLRAILAKGAIELSEHEQLSLAEQKNRHYLQLVQQMGPEDVLPGVDAMLTLLAQEGIATGVASASKNARLVLERLNLLERFAYVADAAKVTNPKPHPEVFLTVADALNVPAGHCLGVEDAAAGVQAIKAAGMRAVGIGDRAVLAQADWVYASPAQVPLASLLAQ
ncbi:beta-phosphoglucomutase [Gallaecimonas sp. GXIMD1310]|uniref:beta-phosphoglucomutase n=1 Tax=Gallaecimonas sp. GXIMD1310 TaxID=3131926 RepID=UPI0032498F90